jgi:hypothetical protein
MTTPGQDDDIASAEWSEGLDGQRQPKANTGFDDLDATVISSLRAEDERLAKAPTELDVERSWQRFRKLRRSAKGRNFGLPFSYGLAAGIAAGLVGALAVFTPRMPDDGLVPKSVNEASSRPAVRVVASDPRRRAATLAQALADDGSAFALDASNPNDVVVLIGPAEVRRFAAGKLFAEWGVDIASLPRVEMEIHLSKRDTSQ